MAKIGFIISSLFACGGEERVVTLIANELARFHQVSIYTYENRRREGANRNDYYLSGNIHVEEMPQIKNTFFRFGIRTLYYRTGLTEGRLSGFLLKKAYYPSEMLKGWVRKIKEDGLDIIIAVSGAYTMLLGYIADQVHAKLISWEHSSFEGYFDPAKGYYRNRMHMYAECAKKLDACVVLNQDIATKYKERLGVSAVVIPNPKSFSSEKKADMSQKCFVACGRVEAEKGYDDLIEAFASFQEKNKEWKLMIIGGGSLVSKLEGLAQEKGVADKVVFTGYIHNVQEMLLSGSVFMMTSRWEGFPMSVTEALEIGLPVIAYSIPAMEPLVSDGVEGRIVPAFDRSRLAEAMGELAADEGLRKKMAANAIAKAGSLEPKHIVNAWRELLERVEAGEMKRNV